MHIYWGVGTTGAERLDMVDYVARTAAAAIAGGRAGIGALKGKLGGMGSVNASMSGRNNHQPNHNRNAVKEFQDLLCSLSVLLSQK